MHEPPIPIYENPFQFLGCTAIVAGVSTERWTCDVMCDFPHGGLVSDVPISSLYYSPQNGHGTFVIPEVGSPCVIIWLNPAYPIILGFLPVPDVEGTNLDVEQSPVLDDLNKPLFNRAQEALKNAGNTSSEGSFGTQAQKGLPGRLSYRMNREGDMLPGDGVSKTKRGNKFKWYSNGSLLAQSTNLCLTIWNPLENKRTQISLNNEDVMPGLVHNRFTDQPNEETLDDLGVKRKILDSEFALRQRKGLFLFDKKILDADGKVTESESEAMYQLQVDEVRTEEGQKTSQVTPKTKLTVFEDGAIQLDTEDDVPITVVSKGDVKVSAPNVQIFTDEEFKVKANQNIDMETLQDILLKAAGKAEIEGGTQAIIKAAEVLVGSDSASQQAVLGNAMLALMNAFIAAFNTHTHATAGGVGTPSAPVVPFLQIMGPTELSTNVKVAT
jgi:hypothetical protein